MTDLQRAMERILKEANDLYPTKDMHNYNSIVVAHSRQAEFVIRELKFEVSKNPDILADLGLARTDG